MPSFVLARLEDAVYGHKLAKMEIDPDPLFIVGHWRSGTTHLHNLLGRDPRHTVPNVYQVIFPGSFLLTGKIGPKLLKNALPETRTYDNVRWGWDEAAEDEIALLDNRFKTDEELIEFLKIRTARFQRRKGSNSHLTFDIK